MASTRASAWVRVVMKRERDALEDPLELDESVPEAELEDEELPDELDDEFEELEEEDDELDAPAPPEPEFLLVTPRDCDTMPPEPRVIMVSVRVKRWRRARTCTRFGPSFSVSSSACLIMAAPTCTMQVSTTVPRKMPKMASAERNRWAESALSASRSPCT